MDASNLMALPPQISFATGALRAVYGRRYEKLEPPPERPGPYNYPDPGEQEAYDLYCKQKERWCADRMVVGEVNPWRWAGLITTGNDGTPQAISSQQLVLYPFANLREGLADLEKGACQGILALVL